MIQYQEHNMHNRYISVLVQLRFGRFVAVILLRSIGLADCLSDDNIVPTR